MVKCLRGVRVHRDVGVGVARVELDVRTCGEIDVVKKPILVWSGGQVAYFGVVWGWRPATTMAVPRCGDLAPSPRLGGMLQMLTWQVNIDREIKNWVYSHFSLIATWKSTQIVLTLELRRDVSTELHRESVELDLTQFLTLLLLLSIMLLSKSSYLYKQY